MSQFGGGNKAQPWQQQQQQQQHRPGQPPPAPTGLEMGLIGFSAAAAGQPTSGPPVFQQSHHHPHHHNLAAAAAAAAAHHQHSAAAGLAGLAGPHPGAAVNPAVTLGAMVAGQQAVSYPRGLGAGPFGGGNHAQLLHQQQQQQVAAAVGATLQQQQHQQQQQQQQHGPPGPGQPTQRVFTGTVTKLHDNFGFVDEDVFFQTSVVKGQNPRVNDRVLVEATYNPNMPFKWNATRIQTLPNQGSGRSVGSGSGQVNPTATPNNIAFGGMVGSVNQTGSSNKGGGRDGYGRSSDHHHHGGGGGGGSRDHGRRHNSPPSSGRTSSRNEGKSYDHSRSPDRDRRRDDSRTSSRSSRDRSDRDRSRDKDRHRASAASPQSSSAALPPPASAPSRKRSRSPVTRRRTRTRSRSRSRSRTRSPPRRRARTTPRYNVTIPKPIIINPQTNLIEIKKRYNNMYIPSDFFLTDYEWMKSFPIHRPFKIQYPAAYHVFNKEHVEPPIPIQETIDPPDADYTFCAKVMLLANPSLHDLYEKTCYLNKSGKGREDLKHPSRVIQFLVGTKGKNETMAIGGPWSESLDGSDPAENPSVLVKTAIRTCKALTGIDLSSCTQWYRFLDIHYRRQETSHKPARTETTVMFLPDIWSLMPTESEYAELQKLYVQALEEKLNPKPVVEKQEEKSSKEANSEEKKSDEAMDTSNAEVETKGAEEAEDASALEEKGSNEEKDEEEEGSNEQESEQETRKPKHWSEIDVKSMRVNELRDELQARGLNSKGLKSQLVGRLQKSIKEEQELEEEQKKDEEAAKEKEEEEKATEKKTEGEEPQESKEVNEGKGDEVEVMVVEETSKKDESNDEKKVEVTKPKPIDEKTKHVVTAAYKTPKDPCIFVHPNPKFKGGKFDCSVTSLSVLLDYRIDDNKEGTFEVSLFAELFSEMLMRDAGFKLYNAILNAPEKEKEKDKEKKPNKKDDKESSSQKESEDSADKSKEESKEEEDNKSVKAEEGNDEKEGKDDAKSVDSPQVVTISDDDHSSSGKGKSEKKEMVTVDHDLLLACSYFDLGHCGYIEAKDLEDLITSLNLNLSRSYIKKLITKVEGTKDRVNYRAFIDYPSEQVEEIKSKLQENDEEKLKEISLGFKVHLPTYNEEDQKGVQKQQSVQEGICNFRGSVVDVEKLMSQLDRSEKARIEAIHNFNETKKSLEELSETSERQVHQRDKLQTEVKDLKKKLRSTEDDLKRSQVDTTKYLTTLKDVYSKVSPLVQPSAVKDHTKKEDVKTEAEVNGKSEPDVESAVKEEKHD